MSVSSITGELLKLQGDAWDLVRHLLTNPRDLIAAKDAALSVYEAVDGAFSGRTDPAEARLEMDRLRARLAQNDAAADAAARKRRGK